MEDEIEILELDSASTSIFASQNSNPRRRSVNPSQGTDLICNCEESKLAAYLKSAVERKDFGFVLRTLHGRELRFRRSEEAMEEEVRTLKRELVAVRETEGEKFGKLMEEYVGLRVKHRETESQLEGLKKRFDNLSKCYTEEILGGLNCGSVKKLEDSTVKEIVPGCETPDTAFMEIRTPTALEKRVETEKECCKVKRTLDFDNEDNTETQGRQQDRIADALNLPAHASDLSVNKVLNPHCSVNFMANNEIEDNSLHRQSDPMASMKRNEDELITSASVGASCLSSKDKPPKDVLQCSIPERKIDMEGSVAMGTDVVILSDSESESSGPFLRKKRLSPCSKNVTCTPKKENIEVDMQSRVKIGEVSEDGGKYSDEDEGQPLRRGAKRRCHLTVTSGSESNSSDGGFSCKRRKPRSGDLQTQVICEAECIKDTRAAARENVQCETSPKGSKEDAVLGAPHETNECRVRQRNMGKEDSLSCEEVEDVPDMKLKRIRKTKEINEFLTVGHCDEQTDEYQGEASPGARFRSLKRVVEGNELPNTGQLDKGVCPDKRAQNTKYRRLKRGGGEAEGPEKSNVGNVPEKNTLDPYINDVDDGTIFNDNGECESSIGGSTIASKGKSDGATKAAEGPSDSPISTQNNRRLRSQSRKMINLTKESDGEDEDEDGDENDSQIDDLGDFIVDSSESEKDSEYADGNKSDSENSTNNSDSEAETNPSSGDDLHEVIRRLSRQRERKLDWNLEGDMLAAFAKDDVLCMRAVCALNRQQTNDERRGKSSFYLNRRGFDKIHASRASLLADFLTDDNPSGPMKKSLQELHKHDSKGAEYCNALAIRHSKQLFEIYRNNEDPHFPHR